MTGETGMNGLKTEMGGVLGRSEQNSGMLGGSERNSRIWDRLACRYARMPVSDEDAYQKRLRVTRRYLQPDMEIMEFGCGTGTTAIAHAPFVKHVTAIDFSWKMLAVARGKAAQAGIQNISFARSDIESHASMPETFDAVMGHSILHLVRDRDTVISRVFDLLKPGGVFVSTTFCMGNRMGVARLLMPLGRAAGLLPLVRFFSTDDLIRSLKLAGFEIDYQWQPRDKAPIFIVAQKPA